MIEMDSMPNHCSQSHVTLIERLRDLEREESLKDPDFVTVLPGSGITTLKSFLGYLHMDAF